MKKPFGWYVGYTLACVVLSCIGIVTAALVLGIAAKAISWILFWLF